MNRTKKTHQEVRGWRFGDVQEFLGLSDEETAYIELKFALSHSLKKRRHEKS